MAYISADAHQLLQALVLEVQALRAMLEADRQGVASGADTALLAAVYAVAGLREFRAGELRDMAQRPGGPEQALQTLIEGRSTKSLGKLLQAAAGKPGAGLVLLGAPSRRGSIWRIRHAPHPPKR